MAHLIRKARVPDAGRILELVNALAKQEVMLPRSPASVIENLRDFVIAEGEDGTFLGCAALHIVWSDHAEIRSIAVSDAARGLGIGRELAQYLIDEANELGIARLFAFTYVPGFFERLEFVEVEHATLPHKVFGDCMNCPKFHACDEIAMLRVLSENSEVHARGPLSVPLGVVPARVAARGASPEARA